MLKVQETRSSLPAASGAGDGFPFLTFWVPFLTFWCHELFRPAGEPLLITKYGLDVVVGVLLVAASVTLIVWLALDAKLARYGMAALAGIVVLFTLYFFRDPDRVTPPGENLVIAPADGTIVQLLELTEEEYIRGPAVQVSIFMSPLNVHVNRFPITGTIGLFRHVPGEFLVAYDDKASTRNERTIIGVERGGVKVLFKQIAGFVARRIVADLAVGAPAVAGERFGMIKFGSRVDLILPKGAEIRVRNGDKTIAGETVIASLPQVGDGR